MEIMDYPVRSDRRRAVRPPVQESERCDCVRLSRIVGSMWLAEAIDAF
jgi:hypothetical protein